MSAKYTEEENGMVTNLRAERSKAKKATRSGNPAKRAQGFATMQQADELLTSLHNIAKRRGEEE